MKKIVWIIIVLLLPLSAGAQINTIEQARDLLSQADLARGNAAGIEWDIDIESRTADRSDRNRLHVIVKDITSGEVGAASHPHGPVPEPVHDGGGRNRSVADTTVEQDGSVLPADGGRLQVVSMGA